jgi:two-component system, OmpR family, sensor histidine kinase KdpD
MPESQPPGRPDPDRLLRLAQREEARAKLKVYLGMAAGVGKTVRMLEDAHAVRLAGVDVVLGLIEPHGRAETIERIRDLEIIPRRKVRYRDVDLEEMDVDAILARRPDVVVVDELPHTDAPGSKNEKRWQDVEEILKAGISVWTALNVQHLEGVQDVVRSATGIEIRELVPDRIVRAAESVVLIDIPVPELQDRLRQGKIYPLDQAKRALQNFFRAELLVRLRELALLQTAELPGHTPIPASQEKEAKARIAVAIPFEPDIARALILRASRIAGRMNTAWFVLYVRQQKEHPHNISAAEHRRLSENVQLAMSLGATVVTRESENVVGTILEFLESEHISLLLVGRPTVHRGLVRRILPSTLDRLIDRATAVDIFVVDADTPTLV